MAVYKCKMCGGTIEFEQGDVVGVALGKQDSAHVALAEIPVVGKLRTYCGVVANGVRLIEVVLGYSQGHLLGDKVGVGIVAVQLEALKIVAVEGIIKVVGEVDSRRLGTGA